MNYLFTVDTDWLRQDHRIHLHFLAKYLSEKGHGVYVLDFPDLYYRTGKEDYPQNAYDATTGAYVFRPTFTKLSHLDRYAAAKNAGKVITKIDESVGIDRVINGGVTYIHALLKLDQPLVYFPTKLVPTMAFAKNSLARQMAQKYEGQFAHKAKLILTLTEDMKAHLIRRGITHHKIEVIHTGVDLEMFTPQSPSSPGDVNVLYLGELRENCGLERFIKSIPYAKEMCPEIIYTLTGYPRPEIYLKTLKTLAEETGHPESIRFQPSVSHKETPPVINNADICVITLPPTGNNHVAFPLKTMEYLACGVPVLSTPLKGVQTAFEGVSPGIVYADYSTDTYGEALGTLAKDSKLRETLGKASRKVAEKRGWNTIWNVATGYFEDLTE